MARPKTTKADKKVVEASEQGMDACKAGKAIDDCPHADGPLKDAWIGGFNGQKSQLEHAESSSESSEEMVSEDSAESTENSGGHNFEDPDVKASEESLKDLLRQLDDLGVPLAEEQFRQFGEDDRTSIRRWVNSRIVHKSKSPVVTCLVPFVKNKALLDGIAVYQADQLEGRRKIFPVMYGKPSATKPEGDPDQQIRMQLKIPGASVSPLEANLMWCWKKNRIEFGRMSINGWEQKEFAECTDTVACVADISGYRRTRTHWIVSFLVDHNVLSLLEANRLWEQEGSARMEPVGEPETDKRAESENPDNEVKPEETKHPAPDLFSAVSKTARNLIGNKFVNADEFYIPSQVKGFSATLSVGLGENNRFYVGHTICWSDDNVDFEDDEPQHGTPIYEGDGYNSLQEALIARVGHLVDMADEESAPKKVLDNLKTHLKFLEDGGQPYRIEDEE